MTQNPRSSSWSFPPLVFVMGQHGTGVVPGSHSAALSSLLLCPHEAWSSSLRKFRGEEGGELWGGGPVPKLICDKGLILAPKPKGSLSMPRTAPEPVPGGEQSH